MGTPFLIPGGEDSVGTGEAVIGTNESMGVFAQFPGATPKYAINTNQRDNEFRETMARMFIQMSDQERELFVKSVPEETRPLAKILSGVGYGGSGGTGFIDFLLTDVSEPFQEKVQIVETLSDNFIVYCFGQAAPQFQYSGVLLNTYQDDQRVWMTRLYRDILRGTQLARRRKLVRLRYDSVIVSGVLVAMQQSLRGTDENSAQFAFTLIPMQYVIFTESVGIPTVLKTAFTEGSQYALASTGVPDTSKIKVAAPTKPPLPTRPRTNEQSDSPYVQSLTTLVKDVLGDRTKAPTTTPTNTVANVRGGVVTPNP